MSESEQPWVEVGVPEADVKMPPDRHLVPATALPMLEVHTLVTVGTPGEWWAIDDAYVNGAPRRATETGEELYPVVPFAERTLEQVRGTYRRTSDLWVYRDGPDDRDVTELPEHDPHAWFDRVNPDPDAALPEVRKPRPARELPSLTGARVRAWGGGTWHWLIAVSEPAQIEDRIMVRVLSLWHWHPVVAGGNLAADEPYLVSLHRLWTY